MIESMVTVTAINIRECLDGAKPSHRATGNAVCLADFANGGAVFVAQPQIPPRNINWFAQGRWVHCAKIGFEKYFLNTMRKGNTEPFYENMVLKAMGINKIKDKLFH